MSSDNSNSDTNAVYAAYTAYPACTADGDVYATITPRPPPIFIFGCSVELQTLYNKSFGEDMPSRIQDFQYKPLTVAGGNASCGEAGSNVSSDDSSSNASCGEASSDDEKDNPSPSPTRRPLRPLRIKDYSRPAKLGNLCVTLQNNGSRYYRLTKHSPRHLLAELAPSQYKLAVGRPSGYVVKLCVGNSNTCSSNTLIADDITTLKLANKNKMAVMKTYHYCAAHFGEESYWIHRGYRYRCNNIIQRICMNCDRVLVFSSTLPYCSNRCDGKRVVTRMDFGRRYNTRHCRDKQSLI